ncbi:MAG: SHOCT domain-containing protein [Firmicutes bacterium]|jgi:uncharacterized membrane protein|nr:SHOCT domain-containing protein [Bacillota bacterium]MCL5013058.1 SHOCT domain-containing protein [Bacillota bacterium]HBQ94734.1 hypothetical protein [Sulfobacillus sp.]
MMGRTFGDVNGASLATWGLLFELMVGTGLIVLVVWAVGACRRTPVSDAPVARLKLQLARGDISLEEYEELRAQLHN